MKKLFLSHNINVCFDEMDFLNRLKPSSYLQYFQDITSKHYDLLGLDSVSMAKKDMFWILSRVSVIIDQQITNPKTLKISTCMRKTGQFESTRDYYVSQNNTVIARAVSRWCVLNINTRKICPTSNYLSFKDNLYQTQPAIEPQIIKASSMRIEDNDNIALSQNLTVRNSDLDANLHMNNARYGDIIFNALNLNTLNQRNIKGFDIHFKNELKPNVDFTIHRADYNNYSLVRGVNPTDFNANKAFFYARIEWNF